MDNQANRRPSVRKVYYQISEVAKLTGVNESTLRNWEEQFDELRNVRRINNRRHYTAADIETIKRIQEQRTNRESQQDGSISADSSPKASSPIAELPSATKQITLTPFQIKELIEELGEVKKELQEIAAQLT